MLVPMVYGYMKNAPTLKTYNAGRYRFYSDYRDVYEIVEEEYHVSYVQSESNNWDNETTTDEQLRYVSGALKIYDSNRYIDVSKYVYHDFNPDTSSLDLNTTDFDGFWTYGQQYYLDAYDTNSVRLATGALIAMNRIQCLLKGNPSEISLVRPNSDNFSIAEEILDTQQTFPIPDQDRLSYLTDGNPNTGVTIDDESAIQISYLNGQESIYIFGAYKPVVTHSLRWNISTSNAIETLLIHNQLNGIRLPVRR